MHTTLRNVLLALSLLAALPRCAKEPTALFVRVNVGIPTGMIRQTLARVYDANQPESGSPFQTQSLSVEGQTTYSFLVESTGRASKVRVEVAAYNILGTISQNQTRGLIAFDRAVVTYAEDRVVDVTLNLRAPCPCGVNEHCAASGTGCAPAEVPNPPRHVY